MTDNEFMVSIPMSRYKGLLEDEAILRMLEGAGVDNWSAYGDSWDCYEPPELEFYREEEDKAYKGERKIGE